LKVIGLDTNISVRYLISDGSDQAAIAKEFIENTCHGNFPGYISHTVLCELAWVLTGIYGYPKEQVVKVRVEQLCVEDPQTVRRALRDYRKKGMNFTDHLIAHAN
jgi:predicted nucleic-acid-binding protein